MFINQRCRLLNIILLLIINSIRWSSCIDHCSSHKYIQSLNTTHMQFTKEAVNQEYAVLGQFKSLHCCAKGYRSIEWFKDGKPYPWPRDVSSLILYPEEANQTVYTREATIDDIGNYTCVLRNDTHKTEHYMELKVQGSSPDTPLATFKPTDQYVSLGETLRFYCEAFIGKVSIPDSRSDIKWYQIFEDTPELEIEGQQEIVYREDDQIVGSYLIINNIDTNNYGRYICRIDIGNSAHRLEMSAWVFPIMPTKADNENYSKPIILGLIAAIITVIIIILLFSFFQKRFLNKNLANHSTITNHCQSTVNTISTNTASSVVVISHTALYNPNNTNLRFNRQSAKNV